MSLRKNDLSPNPSPRREGLMGYINELTPSLLGEGGRGMRPVL